MLLNNITIAKTMPIGKIAFASKRKNKENQGDTFECSSKSKEKSFTINPIKLAKIKAQEIIKNAQYQATTILNDAVSSADAYKRDVLQDADEEMKKYRQEKVFAAQCRAHDEYNVIMESKKAELKNLEENIQHTRQMYETMQEAASKNYILALEKNNELDKLIQAKNSGEFAKLFKEQKAQIMDAINAYTFDYDYYTPIKENTCDNNSEEDLSVHKIKFKKTNVDFIKEPEKPHEIPEFFYGDEAWEYTIPEKEINLADYKSNDFYEIHNQETTISMGYADAVLWDSDKIARDILQNFFDGHGQTLDGVKMSFKKQENGKYKVRIEGKAKYSQEKAILLGESTKRDNAKAAGNYGEGLKVVVLKLLKDNGADEVNIASDNWRVNFTPKKSSLCDREILSFSLLKEEPIEGNYFEFETENSKLLYSLRNAIDNFYHSSNPDFKNLDFENDLFAIKKLDKGEKGSIYIAGQKFEYNNGYINKWKNLNEFNIIFKEKPNTQDGVMQISRDRVSLDSENIKHYVFNCVRNKKTSKEDVMKLLNVLNPHWEKKDYDKNADMQNVLQGVILGAVQKDMQIEFPSYFLAANQDWYDQSEYFYKDNHQICLADFSMLGMRTVEEQKELDAPSKLLEPNEVQIKKIGLIKETLKCLEESVLKASRKPYLTGNLNPNIYIFKASGVFAGEHRQDGFWISDSEMNSSFDAMLSTVLHEIAHKHGGDGTMNFTYALTDMIQALIDSTIKDELTLTKLRAIKSCWEDLNKEEFNLGLQEIN